MADVLSLLLNATTLPVIFALVMGLAMAAYVVLDGYDLGTGMLLSQANKEERNIMVASIGPFWDANETWLVLGVGILLVAFPIAHGIILGALYLPVAFMLIGLTLRGVAFEFRVKAREPHQLMWNNLFIFGSALAAWSQGFMLGSYVLGFKSDILSLMFCAAAGVGLMAGYCLLGASWLIMKTEGALQKKAVVWARIALWATGIGMAVISVLTPEVNPQIAAKWFVLPNFFFLLPIPLLAFVLFAWVELTLQTLPQRRDRHSWVPFAGTVGLFLTGFLGLGYSFFPYIVPGQLTIWQAASSVEALTIILVGALIVLPAIVGYTIYAYRVFWGKASTLHYE